MTDTDKGWKRIKQEMLALKGSYTKVGLPDTATVQTGNRKGSGHKPYASISELVKIGVINEFGSSSIPNRPPARPAFRMAFDKNRVNIELLKRKLISKVFLGNVTAKQALGLMGEFLTNETKRSITDLRTPPNAPSTVARKGSSNPLIDTGQLRASVTHVEVMNGAK